MKITDIIKLANNGITAKDLYTLSKAGYTAEIIEELSKEDESTSLEALHKEAEEAEAARKKAAEDKEKEASEKEALQKENETLKAQLEELQRGNRGTDQSDLAAGADEGSDINSVIEAISSMM